MRNLFHQGAQTSFAPEAKSAVRQLGPEGHAYLSDVHRRVREQIALDFRLPALYSAGMLLTLPLPLPLPLPLTRPLLGRHAPHPHLG